MLETIQFFLAAGVMIGFAKLMGYLAYQLRQPAVLGEIVAGLIIGPTLLNLLGYAPLFPDAEATRQTLLKVGEVGVLLLLFTAGLEVEVQTLARVGKPALLSGVLGVVFPLLCITPVVMLFDYKVEKALFVAILFAPMSTAISAQVMFELGVLRKREGMTLLGASLVDDLLTILLLSLFLALNPGGIITGMAARPVEEVLLRMGGFIVIIGGAAWLLLPRLANIVARLPISEGPLMVALVSTLLLAWSAEFIGGIAAISGAFIAGVCMRRARRSVIEQIERGVRSLNYGFLVPLFFISIGLKSDLRLLTEAVFPFTLVMLATIIVSKMIGVMLGARLSGFGGRSALRVGIGMISRGEVSLIVATIGITEGIIIPEVFAVVVLIVLVTTLITPPLLRWSFTEPPSPQTTAVAQET